MNNDISLVVCLWDGYKCIWDGFFRLFKENFSFWDGPIFSTIPDDCVINGYSIKGNGYRGKDKSFSTRLIATLKNIKSKYILFFLDDFYLIGPTDKDFFDYACKTIRSDKRVKCIVLKDWVKHDARCTKRYNAFFHILCKKAPYKITANVSIYDRHYLLKILRKGESAWDFEYIGTYRSHFIRSLVLYRDDSKHNAVQYFEGGLLKRSKVQDVYRPVLKSLDINIPDSLGVQSNNPKQKSKKHRSDYLYPFLSRFFRCFKKRGNAYPKIIYKINHVKNEDYIKD